MNEETKIDSNTVIEVYKRELSDIQYENILLKAQLQELMIESQAKEKETD